MAEKKEEIFRLMKLRMLQEMMQKPKNYLLVAIGLVLLGVAAYAYMYPQQMSDFVCKWLPMFCGAEGVCNSDPAGPFPVGHQKCVGTTMWECFADATWHPVGVC